MGRLLAPAGCPTACSPVTGSRAAPKHHPKKIETTAPSLIILGPLSLNILLLNFDVLGVGGRFLW